MASKEVYAHFGRAVHAAQLLELSLQGFAVAVDLPDSEEEPTFEGAWAEIEHLFGRTIGYIQKRYDIPSEIADDLEEARKVRNYLAHDYFRHPEIHSDDPRVEQDAIEELDTFHDDLQALAERLDQLMWSVTGEEAPSEEELKRLLEDLPPPEK